MTIIYDDPRLQYPDARHACRVWGNWLRAGRPRSYASIPGTLGNIAQRLAIGYRMPSTPRTAYGIIGQDDTALLVDGAVSDMSVKDSGLMVWYWVRINRHGRPLLVFPPGWRRGWHRAQADDGETLSDDLSGQPVVTVEDYAERFRCSRNAFYNRLNRALAGVYYALKDRREVS